MEWHCNMKRAHHGERFVTRRCTSTEDRDAVLYSFLRHSRNVVFDVDHQDKHADEDMQEFLHDRIMSRHIYRNIRNPAVMPIITEYLQITLTFCDMAFDVIENLAIVREDEMYRDDNDQVLQDVVVRLRHKPEVPSSLSVPERQSPLTFNYLKLVVDVHDNLFTSATAQHLSRLKVDNGFTIIFWLHDTNTRIDQRVVALLRHLPQQMHIGIFHARLCVH